MNKLIVFYLFLVFALAACGTQPTPTAAPAGKSATPTTANNPPSGNDAVTPTNSNTDSNSNTASNSNTGSSGTNSNASTSTEPCTDQASFVSDVTIPDNTLVEPGDHFQKIWLVKNSGACTWTSGYILVFASGDPMGAPDSIPIQETAPGSTTEITVNLTAPVDESVTHDRADFEIRNANGSAIPVDSGTTLWVIVKVDNGSAPKGVGDTSGGGTTGTSTSGSSTGPGYATVSCAFTLDPNKVSDVLTAINAYRAQNGVAPYAVNDQLMQAAQAHADDMACNQLFYHNGSNGSTPASRVAFSGYLASAVTENVYGSYPPLSGADAIQWWANDASDPRHNQNLLSTKYVQIGIGYAFFDNFGYYVIDFATPK